MSNGLALSLAAIILGAIIIDMAIFGTDHMVFWARSSFSARMGRLLAVMLDARSGQLTLTCGNRFAC